jgi:hypothetical protein
MQKIGLVITISGLSLCGCKTSTQSSSAVKQEYNEKIPDKLYEALDAGLASGSIILLRDAQLVHEAAKSFGNEMGSLYNECHHPPQCPREISWSAFEAQGMEEDLNSKHCYPNARMIQKSSGSGKYGFFRTGVIKGFDQRIVDELPVGKILWSDDSGVRNAARHSFVYCYVAALNGYTKARALSDNHEYHSLIDGLEDTWADYWNNEIAIRFGTRFYRLWDMLIGSYADGKITREQLTIYKAKVTDAIRIYQANPQTATDKQFVDIIDSTLISKAVDGRRETQDVTKVAELSCKRYIEGVLRGEVKEKRQDGLVSVGFMTHRPSISTRLNPASFSPALGVSPQATLRFLPPPPKYSFPLVDREGLEFVNTSPRLPAASCIQKVKPEGQYWKRTAFVLPWTKGDYDLYWPSYREDKDRFQEFAFSKN